MICKQLADLIWILIKLGGETDQRRNNITYGRNDEKYESLNIKLVVLTSWLRNEEDTLHMGWTEVDISGKHVISIQNVISICSNLENGKRICSKLANLINICWNLPNMIDVCAKITKPLACIFPKLNSLL